jgi:disulfide bond formation protein DsbB
MDMHFASVIQSRKGQAWVVLIALAIIGILIAAVVLLSGRSLKPCEMDDLYGLLD